MLARAASSAAARLAAAGRLRPAARPRSYHKLIIYGRVQSTPRLEGVDKADASGDSAVAAAAEAAEASAESLPPLRRPTCYFWLSSTVPRFSEWQALSDKRPPPRMRWRVRARGSLALIAEQEAPAAATPGRKPRPP